MPIPTLSRSIPLLLLMFNPVALKAQLLGISDNDPRWGNWRSAPNFPGIEIRVACGTYDPSSGDSQWSFQFRNTYPKKVYLVYQEEAADSSGNPPTFSSPGGRNLDSGEKSDMYTDYLHGSCAARKQIFIQVVSISDDEGNQTKAKAGASQTSALAGAPPDEPKPGNSGPGKSAAAKGGSNPAGGTRIVANQAANSAGLSGSSWACSGNILEYFFLNGALGRTDTGYLDGVTFSRDGTGEIGMRFEGGGRGTRAFRWQQNASQVTLLLGEGENYDWAVTLDGLASMTGKLVFIRYPNVNSNPNYREEGSFTCTRNN